ncbi:hypothetical protein NUW58_g10438 [Xylaria curta]|uniref:Uncharacterized protein n=1 Tax=Xylaria curta TaxID=42375 RepID=A0ACC1ML10_9PEZI|nr:hypothetical protein NUW58_g10438 [Xylaria curta]
MPFDHANISKADAAAYSSSDGDESDNDHLAPLSVDPRADEFLDYNPRKRRRTGRNTKENAALGIFASDSDQDDTPSRRWKAKRNLRHKNVTFVSAGQEQLDQHVDENENEGEGKDEDLNTTQGNPTKYAQGREEEGEEGDGEGEDEDEDEDEDMTGVGLGFQPSTGGHGLGWGQTSQTQATPDILDNTPGKRSNIIKAKTRPEAGPCP